MITIIDYGLGNIKAFVNVYDRLNIKIKIANCAADIKEASKLILPGVGSFDYAMNQLNSSGMRDEIEKRVQIDKIPIIGICVGMQMMAKSSEEGTLQGLGWFDAEVKLFDTSKIPYKTRLPHMGWNSVNIVKKGGLLSNLEDESRFYFLHSYYFNCNSLENIIAHTDYGGKFASAVQNNNIYGIQFHPEKSHKNGIQLLNNFSKL